MKLGTINLMNDCLFKALMTHENNRELVINVLSALTNIDKNEFKKAVFISGEELPKRKLSQKKQITDLTVKLDNKIRIIIEMNQNNSKNIFSKNSTYAFSVIIESTTKNIRKYPQVILINIDNFNNFKTDKPLIEFKLRSEEGYIETRIYQSIHLILENIKNPKYNIDKEIRKFGIFLREEKIEDMKKNYKGDEKYMAAIRTVEDLTTDPDLIGYYDYEEAHKQELREAKDFGLEEGVRLGEKQTKLDTANNLLKIGVLTIEQIAEATNLSISEIKNLKK